MNNRNYIRSERVKKGLTQDDMSKILGIAKPTYCRKENGTMQFTENEMIKIADTLEASLDYLFLNRS